jgi:hypothetical protein
MYAYTNREAVREQTPTPAPTHVTTRPSNPTPPQTFRVTTCLTNTNLHSPRQQTSLLPRVLSLRDQSPLSFLSRISPLAYVPPSHQCTAETIKSLSHRLLLTYASPSHPRVADFSSVLPRTRARNRAPSKRRRESTDGHSSRTYDGRDASVVGPRAGKFAPFLFEFFKPPQEASEWKSTPFCYIRSSMRRFSSVSSGYQASSLGSPGEKMGPNRATWGATSSRPSHPSTPHGQVQVIFTFLSAVEA